MLVLGVTWIMNQHELFSFINPFVGYSACPLKVHCTKKAAWQNCTQKEGKCLASQLLLPCYTHVIQKWTQGAFKMPPHSISSALLWWLNQHEQPGWVVASSVRKDPNWLFMIHEMAWFVTNFDLWCSSCPFLIKIMNLLFSNFGTNNETLLDSAIVSWIYLQFSSQHLTPIKIFNVFGKMETSKNSV